MAVDREHPVWVLGLVGVASSVLTAEGQFTVMDLVIGVTLLLILSNVHDVWSASKQFRLAFSAVVGLCCILVVGPFNNMFLVWQGKAGKGLWRIDNLPAGEDYVFFFLDCGSLLVWAAATFGTYLWLRKGSR